MDRRVIRKKTRDGPLVCRSWEGRNSYSWAIENYPLPAVRLKFGSPDLSPSLL
jgi:hypothetical protein